MDNPLGGFAIDTLASTSLGGFSFSITNNGLYLGLSLVLLCLVLYPQVGLVPSNKVLMGESLYSSLLTTSRNAAGNQVYMPLLLGTFGMILMANLISNVPYNYASTSAVTVSLGLSLTVFIAVTSLAVSVKGWTFLATFVPAGTPNALLPLLVLIELVSYSARAVSLGVRLFANIVAGHTLLTIISGMTNKLLTASVYGFILALVPFAILVVLVGLELAVAFIQAYVFTILTAIYIDESLKPLA